MLGRKTILRIVGIALIGLLLANQTLSQQRQRGQRGQRGGTRDQQGQRSLRGGTLTQQGQRSQRGGMQGDPKRMRQMMEQRLRKQLGATEQQWKDLGPRVMKVSELSRQTRGGGMMSGGMMGGGMMGGGQGTQARQQTAVEKAQWQLRTVLDNTSATPDQIKTQLTALRKARETAKQQLAAAQKDLRENITVRQEAQLVMMDMLD